MKQKDVRFAIQNRIYMKDIAGAVMSLVETVVLIHLAERRVGIIHLSALYVEVKHKIIWTDI